MRYFILLIITLLPFCLFAQKLHTVSGYITDGKTGERLYAASVFEQNSGSGKISNRFGFFSMAFAEGSVALKVSFIGYESQIRVLSLIKDTLISVALMPNSNALNEVVIKGKSGRTFFENDELGHVKISAKALSKLPSLMGEKDLMKSLLILPGVQQGNEGSAGIFVRGGSPDQNLILLDDVPLYNVSHLFGFVSVFTSEAINSVDFYKGGFPARYGGRLSSVVDIRMKDGNKYKRETSINIGTISSQITTEGPIKKGESSYSFSFRRTVLDLLARGISGIANQGEDQKYSPAYSFYDLNGKLNFKLNDSNHLYWSLYSGKDNLLIKYSERRKSIDGEEIYKTNGGMHWGNAMTALKLNSQINPKLFLNTTLSGSLFNYGNLFDGLSESTHGDITNKSDFFLEYKSRIRTVGIKTDCDIYGKSDLPFQLGAFLMANSYLPGKEQVGMNGVFRENSSGGISSYEYGIYLDKNFNLGKRFSVNTGLRNSFCTIGSEKTYIALEPRLSLNFHPVENTSIQASYAVMTQPIHLLSNGTIGLPTDIWVPSTKSIRPETSEIVSLGYKQTILQKVKFSLEGYYKTLDHVISFTEGDGILDVDQNWEQKITSGVGRCYGAETDFRYSSSRITAWAAYTLAWNERKFEEINRGRWYPYQYDRRHKIDLGMIYNLSKQWTASATWTYQSGAPATYSGLYYPGFPDNMVSESSGYTSGNTGEKNRIQYYPQINGVRLPAYHRLDISMVKEWEKYGKKQALSFSIYNVYSRQNAFLVYPKSKPDGSVGLKQFTLFPIIPAISYRISF